MNGIALATGIETGSPEKRNKGSASFHQSGKLMPGGSRLRNRVMQAIPRFFCLPALK
jgi:hypothetical protein